MGAAVQARQAQFLAQAGEFNSGAPPPAQNQPQGEPDPEQPGAGEPPSEQATEAGSEVIEDDSDAETLRFNEGEDRSEYPDNTDNGPYEDAENPEGSQADAGTDPDITQIDIDESPGEAQESVPVEADFKDNKLIAPLAHCAMHFATRAIGYKLKDGKVGDRPAWFTPEVNMMNRKTSRVQFGHKRLRRLKKSKFQKEKVRDKLVHLQENQEQAPEQHI